MAQGIFDINLQDTVFPLLSTQQNNTYINTKDPDRQPQVAYCHNVLPTKNGIRSVDYSLIVNAIPPILTNPELRAIKTVYSDNSSRCRVAWSKTGVAYLLTEGSNDWQILTVTTAPPRTDPGAFDINKVTTGTVNGKTYIHYSHFGCFLLDAGAAELYEVELIGLNALDVLGMSASTGYLIAYTDSSIVWSSTINPLDFVPSQVTGAGGGDISDTDGSIKFVTSNSLGLLIYSAGNIIAATYTGNAVYPFKFRVVEGSKGGVTLDLVGYNNTDSDQYVFSRAGLQTVTSQRANIILPEVTDFFNGNEFEDFNIATKLFERTELSLLVTMRKQVTFIGSRYLVISYSLPTSAVFTHAIVYDTALKKLGKLRINHVAVTEGIAVGEVKSALTLAFLKEQGDMFNLNIVARSGYGVAVLGKVSFSPSRLITLLGVEVANHSIGFELSVSSHASINGYDYTVVDGVNSLNDNKLKKYAFRNTASHHSIVLIGQFDLVNCQITYTVSGSR